MVPTVDMTQALFSNELPSLEDLKEFAQYVNCSELNKMHFAEQIEQNSDNNLSAGIGLCMLGKFEEAAEKLQNSQDCKEKFYYLGLSLRSLSRLDEAIASFEKAEKNGLDSLKAAMEKTATLIKAERFEEASGLLKSFSNFNNVSAEYHFQLGSLEDAKGNYQGAVDNYALTIELDPQHREGLFNLAYTCDLRGNDEAAIDYYKQLAKLRPININALLNLAVLYEDKGEYELASRCVEAVLKDHPNNKRALLFEKDIDSSKVMIYDEEKERRRDRHNKILEIPISDFELSVRSRNCLRKMNINTIGDLLRTTEAELLSYKNFGETSLMEIKKILDSKNLLLGMALEDKAPNYANDLSESDGANNEILSKSVDELELSVRAKRALTRLNIQTLGELISKTEAELLGCKNFGVTSLNEIKDRLTKFDLTLRKLD